MIKVVLLASIYLATLVHSVPYHASSNEIQEFYDALPQNVKVPFLQYELALAAVDDISNSDQTLPELRIPEALNIPPNVIEDFQNIKAPAGFRQHIYRWVQDRYGLKRDQILEFAVRGFVCFPAGHPCFNVGDTGSNCC